MRTNKLFLLAAMALCLASCTKENVTISTQDGAATSSVTYLVGGQRYYSNPQTEEEWLAFIDRMLAMAEEGYVVCFERTGYNQQSCASKETVTFTTNKYEEAKEWAYQMALDGYEVTIEFNQQTGEYTCIATR